MDLVLFDQMHKTKLWEKLKTKPKNSYKKLLKDEKKNAGMYVRHKREYLEGNTINLNNFAFR